MVKTQGLMVALLTIGSEYALRSEQANANIITEYRINWPIIVILLFHFFFFYLLASFIENIMVLYSAKIWLLLDWTFTSVNQL